MAALLRVSVGRRKKSLPARLGVDQRFEFPRPADDVVSQSSWAHCGGAEIHVLWLPVNVRGVNGVANPVLSDEHDEYDQECHDNSENFEDKPPVRGHAGEVFHQLLVT